MGQCVCKERRGNDEDSEPYTRSSDRTTRHTTQPSTDNEPTANISISAQQQQRRLESIGLDVKDLIFETLSVIRTLVNNEQEPPNSMLKLNLIADKEQGWLLITQTMIEVVPADNPLGPAVITLFLDESPLPTKDTVVKLLFRLNLSAELSNSNTKSPTWHRNACIVLGSIAEKLAGANSVATFRPQTLEYLLANLSTDCDPVVILFSLITLEKYAQTSENRTTICDHLSRLNPHPLEVLEPWLASDDLLKHQVGFCAQWALDNIFIKKDRPYSYETVDTKGINAMLNHEDVSEYLKIAPTGLEARCDVSSFESVRCTFHVIDGAWYYEALIVTTGVMQIGWATKDSKFFNHEGYGIGDDEYSVAYDGCRQLIWHNASSEHHSHPVWKRGDILGCLLDMERRIVQFYLNGIPLSQPHVKLFDNANSGFFPAASFMSFQQCQFNFGHTPLRFPPIDVDRLGNLNQFANLSDEQRVILPRRRKLELLRSLSVPEDSCQLCYNNLATVTLKPCGHSGFCMICAMMIENCPLCRAPITDRCEQSTTNEPLQVECLEGFNESTSHPFQSSF